MSGGRRVRACAVGRAGTGSTYRNALRASAALVGVTRARCGLHGLASLGSVSERVAHRARCSVLICLRATTWASDGFWAPDGAYSQYVATGVMALWLVGISRVLLRRASATSVPGTAP